MEKRQGKQLRKIMANPERMPETLQGVDKVAESFKMTKEEFLKVMAFEIAKPFNIFKKPNQSVWRYFSKKYWKERNLLDANLHKANLIRMELNNGMTRTFLVGEVNNGFYYLDRRYVFDLECRYYDLDADLYCYDYHEGLSLPFKKNFPANAVKKMAERGDIKNFEVSYSLNPNVLERFVNSTVIEMLLNGGALMQQLKTTFWVLIGVGVVVLIGSALEGYYLYKMWNVLKLG